MLKDRIEKRFQFCLSDGFNVGAATGGGAAKREKGWNDGGAVKNPLASVSAKDDNWRKQQIKAQGAKLQGKKAGGGGAKKKVPAAAPAEPAPALEAVAGEEGANEE